MDDARPPAEAQLRILAKEARGFLDCAAMLAETELFGPLSPYEAEAVRAQLIHSAAACEATLAGIDSMPVDLSNPSVKAAILCARNGDCRARLIAPWQGDD